MSVPSTTDVQATFAATLVDEWIRHGVTEAVICPGSRSTPLALALVSREEMTCHVRIDERSAGFFAIGCSLRSDQPTIVLVTSGTAAAELHACVAEADLAGVPLIVVTADRPAELHGVGAPQTIRQRDLFQSMVRCYEEPGVPRFEAASSWRPLASRLVRSSGGPKSGPVHLNAAFVEPFIGTPSELPRGRNPDGPWVTQLLEISPRPAWTLTGGRAVVICGPGADRKMVEQACEAGWIVIGDATCVGATPYFDSFLRDDVVANVLRPDIVYRLGGLPASKILQTRLTEWSAEVVAFSAGSDVADPTGVVQTVVAVNQSAYFGAEALDVEYLSHWHTAVEAANDVLIQLDDDATQLSEPALARALVELSNQCNVALVIGSSMPVRDVEWFGPPRKVTTFANRGANGIDGVTSTVFGVAAGASSIGFIGDITFLHDVSALVDGLGDKGGSCALVVGDNRGGGIFSFLPQSRGVAEDTFEQLFGTPRTHDIVEVAHGFGLSAERVLTVGNLRGAVERALSRPGICVIVADLPDRRDNVTLHDELNDLIGRLAREALS